MTITQAEALAALEKVGGGLTDIAVHTGYPFTGPKWEKYNHYAATEALSLLPALRECIEVNTVEPVEGNVAIFSQGKWVRWHAWPDKSKDQAKSIEYLVSANPQHIERGVDVEGLIAALKKEVNIDHYYAQEGGSPEILCFETAEIVIREHFTQPKEGI